MNKIQEVIDKLRKYKEICINLQDFMNAANCRDVERNLIKVNEGGCLKVFLEQFKRSGYQNFDDMYEVIKPLDVAFLRKEKISKIEKLYNNK